MSLDAGPAVEQQGPAIRGTGASLMRYSVMVSSPGADPKTYEVDAGSEQAAAARAQGLFMMENPSIRYFDVAAVIRPLPPRDTIRS